MSMDIPKQYEPKAAQDRWYPFWEDRGFFNADPNPDKKPHTIMIPLPNVTGALHMGHALNGTLQDLITRWRRMQGFEALWMPGTDHAGIATQAVVERRMLEEEGLTRHDVGREALVNRIWKWKDAYEERILGQLKLLGASCDWRRTRFTLDEVCSKAVRRTFFKFFKDGLIYRGKRLVNWDTYLQTAVADDEVFDEEVAGHFWTFTYPVVDEDGQPTGQTIAFSTTRPETMLGDTAVCVHPNDDRYKNLIGKKVQIPLNGRLIPIIADGQLADPTLGTGAVKVTPAHDPNDYACYQRHVGQPDEIEIINILNPDGTINENGQPYQGLDRYECRDKVIDKMESLGHFVEVVDRVLPIKHSDRSKTPIEPYLSDQWFVKMDDLAQAAMDAVTDGRVKFFPSRFAKTYQDWLGEKRDWCISRQLWWGHRIPVWTLDRDREIEGSILDVKDILFELANQHPDKIYIQQYSSLDPPSGGKEFVYLEPLVCLDEDSDEIQKQLEDMGFKQDPDVLDTWFSSALWPHETLGWPDLDHNPPLHDSQSSEISQNQGADAGTDRRLVGSPKKNEVLDYFYPGDVLVTARDIITLWVARMVLTGLYNMGDVPFRHVCVHPNLQDGFGQKMSKSKGNGVDPTDLIDKYGTDAVRFTIASFAGETQDVRLPISYECPHCEELIESKLYKVDTANVLVPQTMKGDFPVPAGQPKPVLVCPKCKKESQFSTPLYDPDGGQPVARVVSERFEYGQKFCNKLWNACRFALLNLEGYSPAPINESELLMEDRWILSRLSTVSEQLTTLLSRYQFDAATRALRDFTWNEFCDWYLEMIKPRLRDEALRPAAQRVLVGVMDALLRMLQPFTPFITEDLWQRLNEIAPERGLLQPGPAAKSVMIAPWPELPKSWQDESLESRFERLQDTIVAVRNVRAVYNIAPTAALALYIRCPADIATDMQEVSDQFDNLAKTVLKAAGAEVQRPPASANFALTDAEGYIPLEGVIDVQAEIERLEKEQEKVRGFIQGHEKKLANENFVNKAPEHVVADVRDTLANLKNQLQSIQDIIRQLRGD